jgi:integrase/recombinase XerC
MPASMANCASIESYLDFLKNQRGLALLTLENYRRELLVLNSDVLSASPATPFEQISAQTIRRTVALHHQGGLAPSSLARRLSAWRGFFDWAVKQGLISANPCRGIKAPRAARRLPKALAPDDAYVLMEQGINPDSATALRDQAILELLYSSGLRLAELISLDWRYFKTPDYESTSWLLLSEAQAEVTGKGSKRRSTPIGSKAVAALNAWLEIRSESLNLNAQIADQHALFLGPKGLRITPRLVQQIVDKAAKQAGIQSAVHPHVLRHSFASHLLQSSADLRAVQELLGHANISTTQIYTSLDFQRLASVYDAAHPRARQKSK